jgi:hypothetical protein
MAMQTATNAQIAAKLLRGAADFFRTISKENPGVKDELEMNAKTCEMAADRVELDPGGEAPPLVDGAEG